MCTAGVKEALAEGSESFKDKAIRDDHQKQYSKAVESAQHNVGQASGDMWKSADMAAKGTMDWFDKNTMSLRPSSTDDDSTVSDTVSANYTKSSSEKSSQTKSTAKKKGGEGTGGSKSQFYAKK